MIRKRSLVALAPLALVLSVAFLFRPSAAPAESPGRASILLAMADEREHEPAWKRLRRIREEEREGRRGSGADFGFAFEGRGTYDRVGGVSLWQRMEGTGGGDYVPEVTVRLGYSFGNDNWQHESTVLQPVAPDRLLFAGASWYRITRSRAFDEEIVSDRENTLAAVLFKEDYRDYYRANGYALLVESRPGHGNTVQAGYRRDDLKTLRVTSEWSLFHGDWEFRPNDAVNAGEARSFEARYVFDSRRREGRGPQLGVRWELQGERAGKGGLGGDFRYQRWMADLRQYTKLSPGVAFDARLAVGALDPEGGAGALYPEHREFYAGGIGTLPGYGHKQWRGDRLFLANLEYRIGRGAKLLLLADAGDAWLNSGRDFALHTDVAVGFETDDSGLRILLAEPVGEEGSDPVLWVRLKRTF